MKTIEMKDAMILLEEAEKLSRAELEALQKERLHELVGFVRENSPFYRELYRDIPEDYCLEDLPPVRKEELIPRYDEWVTERGITREDVLSFIQNNETSELYRGKYSALRTSGTTGNPMPFLRDSYHNVIHGALMGRRLLGSCSEEEMDFHKNKRLGVIFTGEGVSSYSAYKRAMKAHPGCEKNSLILSTTEPSEKIFKAAEEFQPDILNGYPTSLLLLAKAQLEGRIHLKVHTVVSSAELMTEPMYNTLKKAFNCRILNNYCATEGGEMAMAADCPHLHINEDWILIEPVDKDGKVLAPDSEEMSEGVYITDLTNQIQPVIRYYLADCVRIHTEDDGYNRPFRWMEVQGRTCTLFSFCGKPIISHNLKLCVGKNTVLWQFIQNAENEMEIRIVPAEGNDRKEELEEAKRGFTEMMENQGCTDFNVVCSMEEPKKNERGGKLSDYIRNF